MIILWTLITQIYLLPLDIGIVKSNIGNQLSGLLSLETIGLMIIYYLCIVIWMRGMRQWQRGAGTL